VRLLQGEEETRNIPVIFLTAVITKKEEEKTHLNVTMDEKAYPTIAKPFDDKELLREVRLLLGEDPE